MSDSLWPQGLQHARPPFPSPTPGVYPNSCPLSRWCHQTISSSVTPFSHLNLSQHQGLFKWVSSFHQVPKYLSFSFGLVFVVVVVLFLLVQICPANSHSPEIQKNQIFKTLTLPHQRSEVCLPMTYVWAAYSNCFLKSITPKGVKRITSW